MKTAVITGAASQLMGAATQLMGAATQLMGAASQLMGAATQFMGAVSLQILMKLRQLSLYKYQYLVIKFRKITVIT